jgi:hypothetical protein
MKIQPYVEKLEESQEYKDFIVKYPDAYMVAGFFVLDLEEGNNVHQIDFYVPSQKKIAAFSLDGDITVKLLDMLKTEKKDPQKLDMKTRIDLDALSGILADEMHNRGMSEEIKKVIAVIQNIKGKKIWNLNCILTGMEVLKSHIEDDSETVLKIEKTSLMDIMKKIPSQALVKAPETKEEMSDEVNKLEKLQEEISREKEKLKKELTKKPAKKKK